jgi:hypothetical protein
MRTTRPAAATDGMTRSTKSVVICRGHPAGGLLWGRAASAKAAAAAARGSSQSMWLGSGLRGAAAAAAGAAAAGTSEGMAAKVGVLGRVVLLLG